jgi:hypothetical protein
LSSVKFSDKFGKFNPQIFPENQNFFWQGSGAASWQNIFRFSLGISDRNTDGKNLWNFQKSENFCFFYW